VAPILWFLRVCHSGGHAACGLVWEGLNFWAGAKWVYHVPYWEHVKIFEMPLLGFLGFGPFAIAFVEMYRFVRYGCRRYFLENER